jgi:hypothetical protein
MRDYFTYKIIPDLKLIIEFGSGDLNYEKAINLKLEEIKEKDYNATYNFLVIFTHCTILLTKEDLTNYLEFLKEHKDITGKRRSALLTNTPNHIVFSYLHRESMKEFPINFEVFSTLPAALFYLGLPMDVGSTINALIDDWLKYATYS